MRAAELFPSSFRTMDDKLLDQIAALDGAERMEFILENCFSLKADFGEALCDFPLVEIEENLCVLELESAKAFESFEEKLRPFIAAAALVSAYMDLGVDGKANLFLPYADGYKVLAAGAVLAKNVVPIEVFFGTSESETAVENVTCFEIDRADVKLIIRDFSDFDDYVLDPISALAAGAYDAVDADETPSIIVSVASPMRFATEVLSALGVRAKDEKVAREKLEELFAVEPIEE